MLQL
jgi:chromosome segregation ATPase